MTMKCVEDQSSEAALAEISQHSTEYSWTFQYVKIDIPLSMLQYKIGDSENKKARPEQPTHTNIPYQQIDTKLPPPCFWAQYSVQETIKAKIIMSLLSHNTPSRKTWKSTKRRDSD